METGVNDSVRRGSALKKVFYYGASARQLDTRVFKSKTLLRGMHP